MKKERFTLSLFLLILMTDFTESFAEVLFKKGTGATGIHHVTIANFPLFIGVLLHNPFLWLGVGFYLVNFLLWITVLAKVDLSVAYPVGSAANIIVPLLSMIFLHERVTTDRWLGIALIIIGVYCVTCSTKGECADEP